MTYTVAVKAYRNDDGWVVAINLPTVRVQAGSAQQAEDRVLRGIATWDDETLVATASRLW